MIYLYQDIFDNNDYIDNILFRFFSYKLLANIGSNKILIVQDMYQSSISIANPKCTNLRYF